MKEEFGFVKVLFALAFVICLLLIGDEMEEAQKEEAEQACAVMPKECECKVLVRSGFKGGKVYYIQYKQSGFWQTKEF